MELIVSFFKWLVIAFKNYLMSQPSLLNLNAILNSH